MKTQLEILNALRVANADVTSPDIAAARFESVVAFQNCATQLKDVTVEEVSEHG